jgi:diguanylate cyclase (GGDEF)-like protein/PAS domain S-box-containing protein
VFDFELVKRMDLYKTSRSGQCFLNCLITPLGRPNESPRGYLVHVRDITANRRAEELLRESHAQLEATLNALPDLMFEVDREGTIYDFRAPRPDLLYAAPEYFLGRNIRQVLPEDAADSIRASLEQAGRHGVSFGREYSLILPGGISWFELSLAAKGDPASPAAHFIILAREITRRKQSEDALREANEQLRARITDIENLQTELREQALHDPLTGLFNRRYLRETLGREFARVAREKQALSAIVMDVDHFKRINDTHGHQVGDQFLVAIADLIRRLTRSSDIACRYGGEEFLLIMPGSTLKTAALRAEQLRVECAGIRIPHDGQDLSVTVSFGVATYPVHGQEAEDIVIKADKALYRSKQRGRNCVTIWGRGLT